MADNNDDRWNDDNRWAGEADYGQERDAARGYREGRYGDPDPSRYEGRPRGGGGGRYRGPQVNQDIGYGSGSLATGGYAATRAPGSFSDYGASSSGGYGDGYGAYGGPAGRRPEPRSYGEAGHRSQPRGGYRADDRYDNRFGGAGTFATDELLDRQARGEDRSFWGRMFHRDERGEHRGRGPKNYTRSDERILGDVNDRLTDDSWLDAQEITVEVVNREVTLSGTVVSRDDKRRAEELAESVSGVDHVQNNLRVARKDNGDTTATTPLPQV